jgi:threonine/homoserine/homoserine lactone efflux protein
MFTHLVAFVVTATIIELTPGPNMAYLAALAATRGRVVGFAAVGGVALGLSIVGVLAALGVGAAVQSSPLLWEALRWGGVGYLLWLAYDTWRGEEAVEADSEANGALFTTFRRGLITNLLNPKAAVFYIAILPQFLSPTASAPVLEAVTYSVIYVAIATGIHAGIVTAAGALQPFFADEARQKVARRGFALALVGIAIWFAITTAGGPG